LNILNLVSQAFIQGEVPVDQATGLQRATARGSRVRKGEARAALTAKANEKLTPLKALIATHVKGAMATTSWLTWAASPSIVP
jgi:hypothetical protein